MVCRVESQFPPPRQTPHETVFRLWFASLPEMIPAYRPAFYQSSQPPGPSALGATGLGSVGRLAMPLIRLRSLGSTRSAVLQLSCWPLHCPLQRPPLREEPESPPLKVLPPRPPMFGAVRTARRYISDGIIPFHRIIHLHRRGRPSLQQRQHI